MRPALAVLVAAALVLVACGGDDDDDVNAATTTASTTTTVESTTTTVATTTVVTEPIEVDPTDPRSVVAAYVTSESLRWPADVVVEPGDEPDSFRVTEGPFGLEGTAIVQESDGQYEIEHFSTTFGGEDVPASVSLGNGNDSVDVFWDRPPELEARLRISFGADGSQIYEDDDRGRGASWTFDLGPEDTAIRFVEVAFVDLHDQVAREVWSARIPAGPFAAG